MKNILLLSVLVLFMNVVQAQDPFWTQVEGPYAGSFWAGRVMSDGTYYAGTGDGRVLRKLPGESTWRLVATTPGNQTLLSFNEYDGWVFAGDANGSILASTDNFESYIIASVGIPEGSQIRSMFVADDGFFLGTGSGIFKYVFDADRGTPAWELTSFNTPRGKFVFSLAEDASGTRYVGSGVGLYGSTDGGITWEPMGFTITATTIFSIATHNNDVYIGTANGVYVHYETSPPGEWTTLARLITRESFSVRNVSVINGRVYISVTGVGTYYSDDDTNWVQLPYSDARAGFFQDNEKLIVATGDGVWSSSLDQPLNEIQKIGAPESITLLTSARSKLFAVAGSRTLYQTQSPRTDNNWTVGFRVYSEGAVKCYAESPEGNRYINLTGAATGASLFGFTMFPDQDGYDAVPFPAEVSTLNQFYVTGTDSVLIATNIGIYYFNTTTFEIKRLSKITLMGVEVFSLAEDLDGNLYAATAEGFYVSEDNGKTWGNAKLTDTRINQVCPIGRHEGYAATDKGLYYFADLISDPVPIDGFASVKAVVQDGIGHIYVIDGKTTYYAADKNSRFEDVTGDLAGLMPRFLRVVDNYVYIGTDGGLFRHAFAEYAAISLTGLGDFTYDGATKPAVATTDPSGLDVEITYNKTNTLPQAPGLYKVKAKVNDGVYFGEAFGNIIIGGIPASVQIAATDFVIYDGIAHAATATTDPPGLNVTITYNDVPGIPVNAGSYVVKAIITGENYAGADYDTIVIDKAQQYITLEDLPDDVLETDGPFTLSATSSVGLPVTFTVVDGPASVRDNILTLTGGDGEVIITALQDGNHNYYSANTVMHRIHVWTGAITGAESDVEKALSVYPVPVNKKQVTIKHPSGISSIQIMDVTGRSVGESIRLKQSVALLDVNTASLPAGIFLLVVETGKRERIFRRIEIIK